MHALVTWLVTVTTFATGCGVVGGVIAFVMRRLGLEYLVVVRGLPYEDVLLEWGTVLSAGATRGTGVGLTLGALVAAGAVVGPRRVARPSTLAAAGAGVLLSASVCSLLSGALAYLLLKCGWELLPESIAKQVGQVYRVGFSYGLEYGAVCGGIAGALIAGLWIYAGRSVSLGKAD